MSNLIINPDNETYIRIECDEAVARDLHDYFTITIPNPQFLRRGWNGKLRLLDMRKMRIYKGLIPYIQDWAKKQKLEVTYSDPTIIKENDITLAEVSQFASQLQISNRGKQINPYEHQIVAVTYALRKKRLTLVSPTASGKSLVMYLLIRSLVKKKILIIVPTTNLVEQLFSDFEDYSSINGWNVLKHVHRIYYGYEKITNKPIIISTWQSLQSLDKSYFEQFDGIFGDEAHGCSANSLKTIIGHCINAKYRIGLTGTIQDTKCHVLVIEGLFGQLYRPTTTSKLIKEKKLSYFKIKCIILTHEKQRIMTYHEELEYLVSNPKRNQFICNLALSLKNNTLILYQYVHKHGLILKSMLEQNSNDKKIYFISGNVDTEIREEIRKIAEKEDNAIIIASYQTFSFGANMNNLHNIIFASPSKSRIRVMQSIGRELRLNHNKSVCFLFDIADDLSYDTKVNHTYTHFNIRTSLYEEEKFPYETYNITLGTIRKEK